MIDEIESNERSTATATMEVDAIKPKFEKQQQEWKQQTKRKPD